MSTRRIAKTCVRLMAGCSLALLVAAGGGAFAHGSHSSGSHVANSNDHFSSGGHGRCVDCGGANWNSSGDERYHRHPRHHKTTAGSRPPLHGAGSSHNPIVYHPVHGPGSSHNPVIASKPANGVAPGTVVRDHRNGKDCSYVVGAGGVISSSTCPRGRRRPPCSRTRTRNCIPAIPAGAAVRDHRTSSAPPQCYGDLC